MSENETNNVIQLHQDLPCAMCGSTKFSGRSVTLNLSEFGLGTRHLLVCNACVAKEVKERFDMMDVFAEMKDQ